MKWINVASSSIARVRYDERAHTLEVEFKNGRIYRYFAVPERVYAGLRDAESPGRYFQEVVRDEYHYARDRA